MQKRLLLLLIGLCSTFFSYGQISQGGIPKSFIFKNHRAIPLSFVNMPSFDIDKLIKEDSSRESLMKPARYGYRHDVKLNNVEHGQWQDLDNGGRIWRLAIQSRGAYSLGVIFSKYQLPKGAEVFIYSEDKAYVIGAFTSFNNQEDKLLGTGPVRGDRIIVEYYEPSSVRDKGILEIGNIIHDYKNFFKISRKAFGSSGNCHINVNCSQGADWQDQKRSVALILANGYYCSGAMVNNTSLDGKPYFLTADHCFDPKDGPLSTWVFHFNYESPGCTNVNGSLSQSVSGAYLRAQKLASDFLLLELRNRPPDRYNVYYAGWNRINSAPANTVGIHHPSGDIKKISFDNHAPTSYTDNFLYPNAYWQTIWDLGTATEGGSSGSPLFDNNKRIIGQLMGGYAECGGTNMSDFYGKLSYSWEGSDLSNRLSSWLDPVGTNVSVLDGDYFQYCLSEASYSDDSVIERVEFGTMVNQTGVSCRRHSDFTHNNLYALPGETIPLTIGLATCENNFSKAVKVFIDWNLDFNFDEEELVSTSESFIDNFLHEDEIVIPEDIPIGFTTRMRIVCVETNNSDNISPCGTYDYGETQDYTIRIGELTSVKNSLDNNPFKVTVSPNPVEDAANVRFSLQQADKVTIEILNIFGSTIDAYNLGDLGAGGHKLTINSASLKSGTYFIRLRGEANYQIVKFIRH